MCKRLLDVVVVLLSSIIFSPMVIWACASIYLYDRGPLLYSQIRVGKNRKLYKVYKFRTMIKNAESMTGPVLSGAKDDRVTPVGRVLRRIELDEYPQVINILKGEMSMVGPRPERPELMIEIEKECPNFSDRLSVLPGVAGIAQLYGDALITPRNKLRYDMLYIRNMSMLLDIKILLLSVWMLLIRFIKRNNELLK